MNTRSFICLLVLNLTGLSSFAQIELSAELRPRTELNQGVKSPTAESQKASLLTSQRTRLNASFKNEDFALGIVLQDVRLWGTEAQLTSNGNNVSTMHQAWAEWFISPAFSLKAGRQELAYDDHRILGNVGWAQQARAHDLFLFKYSSKVNLHLGLAYHNSNLNNNIYTGPDAYKAMQFLWLNHQGEHYSASFLFLNNGVPYWKDATQSDQGIRYSQTLGTHLKTSLDGLQLAGNFYYQMGEDAAGNDLSAINFSIDGQYRLSDVFQLGAGFEHLSGTDQDQSDKNNSFNPLYGTNHKFNGFMDYFFVGNHINNVGLNDLYAKASYKPGKINFNGALHLFSADGQIIDQKSFLGTELDLWCAYKHNNAIQIDFGYSHMFASESLYALKGVDNNSNGNHWAWVMLTFKPTLYKP